jgi:hypothetical protein
MTAIPAFFQKVPRVGVVSTPSVNSNSAAFGIGDRAEGIATGDQNARVDRQAFDLNLPGESASPKVRFNCTTEMGC